MKESIDQHDDDIDIMVVDLDTDNDNNEAADDNDAVSFVENEKVPKPPKNAKDIIRNIILIVAILAFVYSAYMLIRTNLIYSKEGKKNNKIKEEVIETVAPTTAPKEEATTDPNSDNISPSLTVDMDKLREINPSALGWIEIPSLGVSYPIVQGEDNDYYLKYDITNNFALSGAIYLDYRSNPDLSEDHYTIYGHHTGDGTMFTYLINYDSEDFFKRHQEKKNNYIYIYQEDKVMVYQIFSVTDVEFEKDPNAFTLGFSSSFTKEDYLNHLKEIQLYDTGINVTENDYLITLYTCQSDSTSKIRHMVHGKLVKIL